MKSTWMWCLDINEENMVGLSHLVVLKSSGQDEPTAKDWMPYFRNRGTKCCSNIHNDRTFTSNKILGFPLFQNYIHSNKMLSSFSLSEHTLINKHKVIC